jgi:DNA polymerase alpha subunit A
MFKLQVLPLTKQLTNLAGNLWSRSLKGARAERIEYLLLHEFHKLKFIMPDKERWSDKRAAAAEAEGDDDDVDEDDELGRKGGAKRGTVAGSGTAARHAKGRNKPAYAGGLVLEPKKDLYTNYVLLLDFQSLYPSSTSSFVPRAASLVR